MYNVQWKAKCTNFYFRSNVKKEEEEERKTQQTRKTHAENSESTR